MELDGAVAIVTGGGSGIGRATALLLARRQVQVVVVGRSSGALEHTVSLIESSGGHGIAMPTDVRTSVSVDGMVKAVLARFSRIDVLVNSAGVAVAKPVGDTTEEDWDQVVDTNLRGVFLCCRAVLPTMMTAGQGNIINVSSILGRTGLRNYGAYCASKFGVIGLTEAMAAECQGTGIRVFAVCPGPTFTELHRRLVGEVNARRSMAPEYVGGKIVALVAGHVPEGSPVAVVVDEPPPAPPWDEAGCSWRQRARGWVRPVLTALRRARSAGKWR